MPLPKPLRMDADAFVAWSIEQEGRYELDAGEVVGMASERAAHARIKGNAYAALRSAATRADLSCEAFTDGMAVRIDATTIYEPNAAMRCGSPLDGDAVIYDDPVVVIEVSSPSTRGVDAGKKLAGYFRLPSVRHYLILDTDRRVAIHHARDGAGAIATTILTEGAVPLDPPGIALGLAEVFAAP